MSDTFSKKYKVIFKIGEGSFSEVLKCQDKGTGELYAAKRLKKIYFNIKEIWACPEVTTMRKITRHPNILYVIECLYDSMSGRVTLIFELMDMSLYDMMKARKGQAIMEYKIKLYFYQLLKGLEHLHKHGIFHRDIKPENVLIKGDSIKLADLGSVRGIYSKPPYTDYISTRWYRPPECLLTTGFYGPKMDIWASGCVFYELLTLKPLFPGSNELDQISRIHEILGTPHSRLMSKFRKQKLRNCFFFPPKKGQGLYTLVPYVTEAGRDLLRLMLIYDPEYRSNVTRLLDHRYFIELRDESPKITRSVPQTSSKNLQQWRNPVLMSHVLSQKRRKSKPLNVSQSEIQKLDSSKFSRIPTSDSILKRKSYELNTPGMLNSFRNNACFNYNLKSTEWISNHSHFSQMNTCSRTTSIVKTEASKIKLPNIRGSCNNIFINETPNMIRKINTEKCDQLKISYSNLRMSRVTNRYFHEGETGKQSNEPYYKTLPQEITLNQHPVQLQKSGYQFIYNRQERNLRRFDSENRGRRMPEMSGKRSSFNMKSPYVNSPAKKIAKHEL